MLLKIQKKIDKSLSIIEDMLRLCQNPYIALSFGKDSIVMFDLINQIQPSIPCLFLKSEESFLLYNFEDLISWYKEHHELNLMIIETNRLTENNFDWEKARKMGNKDFELFNQFDYDGVFMGLRIEESNARRVSIIQPKNNEAGFRIMQYKTGERKGTYRCCPIADWTTFEIIEYIKEKNLKMLNIYEEFGGNIRTTARLTGDSVRNASLHWIKINNPENWRKIIELLPELKNY